MTKIHLRYAIMLFCLLPLGEAGRGLSQTHVIHDSNIASLQVVASNDWQGLPLTSLGGSPINISFDELSHDYHRYTYRIEHCEYDWTPTEGLFTSDYLSGFSEGALIENYAESVGTYQLYTHYSLTIPNRDCAVTMSGNYRLFVYDDDDTDEPVLEACFMVTEPSAGVTMRCTTNTDVDINNAHQQIEMQVHYGSLTVSDPRQIKTVVLQNQHWASAVINPKYQYTLPTGIRWEHCRELIFLGGNEYHKFETLDPSHTTMGLAQVGWDDDESMWHAWVAANYPTNNYSYDVDANGSFLIRNSDNIENDTESDYVWTHFQLFCPPQNGDVYLSGAWTYGALTPEYLMEWNAEEHCYECAVLLKQGYYSYRYLLLQPDGTLTGLNSEGNFYETENRYDALVYFRGPGDRTDRLVAASHLQTRER